jgi:wobble nucleotide-excising tRNase
MIKICSECGKEFDEQEAKEEYEAHFDNEVEYFGWGVEELCAECAIVSSEEAYGAGKAICDYDDMVHGEIPYSDDIIRNL